MTTGPAVDPDKIEAPPNVDVVQAAPHSWNLPEASVVITHAGHGTMIKVFAAGVPLVCIPMACDQKDNTVRALQHGAGVRLSVTSTPDKIAAAVADLSDHSLLRGSGSPFRTHPCAGSCHDTQRGRRS